MKGYIYPMFQGADPGIGWHMTDPIFRKVPTLGACMPNIRKVVVPGDYIFVVSGRVRDVTPFVVGGFKVAEKITALEAYKRFPANRMTKLSDGTLTGNVIVNADGTRNKLDYHSDFRNRILNYVVGRDPVALTKEKEISIGRAQTLDVLRKVFDTSKHESLSGIIARWRRLEEEQIEELLIWLQSIKEAAR